MENITELRAICQKPKIEMRKNFGVSYTDLLSQFDLKISIYFTWIFLRLKMTANEVTVLSGIFCIIGAFLLASKSIWVVMAGVICFYLYLVIDYCDGEVARYNKQSSITGQFLDWYMHFLRDACMFIGLSIGAFRLEYDAFMLIFGFFAVVSPILSKSITNCGWTAICWRRLEIISTGKELIKKWDKGEERSTQEILLRTSKKPSKISAFKQVSMSIFNQHWSAHVLLILVFVQIAINITVMRSFDFRPILVIYAAIIGPTVLVVKLRRVVKDNVLENGYQRLFADPNPINPKGDYFF